MPSICALIDESALDLLSLKLESRLIVSFLLLGPRKRQRRSSDSMPTKIFGINLAHNFFQAIVGGWYEEKLPGVAKARIFVNSMTELCLHSSGRISLLILLHESLFCTQLPWLHSWSDKPDSFSSALALNESSCTNCSAPSFLSHAYGDGYSWQMSSSFLRTDWIFLGVHSLCLFEETARHFQ